jgi:hypothetical protein
MGRQPDPVDRRRFADFVVLLLIAAFVTFYCIDAVRASTHILNLILILPLSIGVFVMCLAQMVLSIRKGGRRDEDAVRDGNRIADVLPVAGLFAIYVLSLPWLGFDVGTFVFLAVFLRLHGERRLPWLLGYAIAFAFVTSVFFSQMLPYPMPMLVLGSF